ncbi:collagen alpha-1(XIV) chain [Elysia marginata]|uniref:Collagen alpha-1(XIV) chain n=1 Tax=Elysia marginata TaxID=1093978 RepID=A0AAV4G2Y2_9GAST|nr:collagen alpha-1(XIV) chain [Elysia marginata]
MYHSCFLSDPFKNVPSPCVNNPSQKVYFPHPTDNTKFLQCDIYGRMYVIQCPQGEVYENTLTACRPGTSAPRATNPPAVVATTKPPTGLTFNPCTTTALASGQLYFAIVGDNTKFIECDLAGNPTVMNCPSQLLWDQGMQSCIFPINSNTGGTPPVNPTTSLPSGLANPCTAIALQNGVLFHPVPNDNTKFIQCDLWGQAFLMDCPSGFVWNATYKVCVNPNIMPGKK